MARTGESVARVILAAAVGGIVGVVGWSIVMQALGLVGWSNATALWVGFSSTPPGTIVLKSVGAFGALAAGCACLAREVGRRGVP